MLRVESIYSILPVYIGMAENKKKIVYKIWVRLIKHVLFVWFMFLFYFIKS